MLDLFNPVLLLLLVLGVPICVLGAHYASRRALRWLTSRPVVRICRVENRIGVVLRKDHEKYSKKFWKSVDKIESSGGQYPVSHRGLAIPVMPIYVFAPDSQELRTLLNKCRPEKSVFNVPDFFQDGIYALRDAHKHIFGRAWDGQHVSS